MQAPGYFQLIRRQGAIRLVRQASDTPQFKAQRLNDPLLDQIEVALGDAVPTHIRLISSHFGGVTGFCGVTGMAAQSQLEITCLTIPQICGGGSELRIITIPNNNVRRYIIIQMQSKKSLLVGLPNISEILPHTFSQSEPEFGQRVVVLFKTSLMQMVKQHTEKTCCTDPEPCKPYIELLDRKREKSSDKRHHEPRHRSSEGFVLTGVFGVFLVHHRQILTILWSQPSDGPFPVFPHSVTRFLC